MMIISFKEKTSSCPYCQKMKAEEDYAFGIMRSVQISLRLQTTIRST